MSNPETLPPHQELLAALDAYLTSIPNLSAEDYTFSEQVLVAELSIAQLRPLQALHPNLASEFVREILELPQDIIRDSNKPTEKDTVKYDFYEFAEGLGIVIGYLTADVDNVYTPHEKHGLLHSAQSAITSLVEKCQELRTAEGEAEKKFRQQVSNLLDRVVEHSIHHAHNLTSDILDAALRQAIFLTDAGRNGYVSESKLKPLEEAWASTNYNQHISVR